MKTSVHTYAVFLVAQSGPTLCNPMDCSLPGSSVHGTFQARILEWVAISFSRRSSQPRDRTQVSRVVGRHLTAWATGEVPGQKRERKISLLFINRGGGDACMYIAQPLLTDKTDWPVPLIQQWLKSSSSEWGLHLSPNNVFKVTSMKISVTCNPTNQNATSFCT